MKKYKKRPIEIEAFQLTREFFEDFFNKFSSDVTACSKAYETSIITFFKEKNLQGIGYEPYYAMIPTLEGRMRANVNDWIIKEVQGEYYPCKPDIFEQTYDLVDDD